MYFPLGFKFHVDNLSFWPISSFTLSSVTPSHSASDIPQYHHTLVFTTIHNLSTSETFKLKPPPTSTYFSLLSPNFFWPLPPSDFQAQALCSLPFRQPSWPLRMSQGTYFRTAFLRDSFSTVLAAPASQWLTSLILGQNCPVNLQPWLGQPSASCSSPRQLNNSGENGHDWVDWIL